MKTIQQQITQWLKDYSQQSQLGCFVVGVSGGVDSAVVSALCADTGIHTIAVNMPIRQRDQQIQLADDHMRWLTSRYRCVETVTVNLTPTFEQFEYTIDHTIGDRFTSPLAFANSRSRLRMITLYQIAQSVSGLVVGTGNRVEDFGVGFFTKWGDGGVDISPIGDLLKSEVRALGAEMGIIEDILQAAPTDGLWDDARTDQDQLTATYEELEWAMTNPKPRKPSERQRQVLAIYQKFNRQNQHKMNTIPVCTIDRRELPRP